MTKDAALAGHSDGFDLTSFLPFRLTVLSNRLTRRVARFYAERYKLTAPEWRTIAVLGQHGAMTANAVIVQTTMDKVRVSRAVALLLKAGYVTRESDPLDRRRAILDLTPRGTELYRQIVPLVQEVETEVLSTLSVEDRNTLEQALGRIEAVLDRSREPTADSD